MTTPLRCLPLLILLAGWSGIALAEPPVPDDELDLPVAPEEGSPKALALEAYSERWLAVGELRRDYRLGADPMGMATTVRVYTWGVYEGGSSALTALQFARRVDDAQMRRKIGVIRLTTSLLGLGAIGGGALCWQGVEENSYLTTPGIVLPAAGLAALVLGITATKPLDRLYEPSLASPLAVDFNNRLRAELGLHADDTMRLELEGPVSVWKPGVEVDSGIDALVDPP